MTRSTVGAIEVRSADSRDLRIGLRFCMRGATSCAGLLAFGCRECRHLDDVAGLRQRIGHGKIGAYEPVLVAWRGVPSATSVGA